MAFVLIFGLILAGVIALRMFESDTKKIERLKKKALSRPYPLYASGITRILGRDGVYRGNELHIHYRETHAAHKESGDTDYVECKISWNNEVVYNYSLSRTMFGVDAYGRRHVLDSDDIHPYETVRGYIPGGWEAIIERTYAEASKTEKEKFNALKRPTNEIKKNFGL